MRFSLKNEDITKKRTQFEAKRTQFWANFEGNKAKTNPNEPNFTYSQSRADKIAFKIYPLDINWPIVYMIFRIRLWLI